MAQLGNGVGDGLGFNHVDKCVTVNVDMGDLLECTFPPPPSWGTDCRLFMSEDGCLSHVRSWVSAR